MRSSMKTHPLNVSYLVIGLIFLGLAGSWALRESGVIDLGEVRWLLPLTLVAAGVIGLIGFAAKGMGNRSGHDEPDATNPYTDYDTTSEGDIR
jgi:hypothetical protein